VAKPDGSDLRVYASGLINPHGLTFSEDGRLFAMDNGPDYADKNLTWDPPDELNLIEEGGD
jgi:glucose/arabinose dehydrogenase